MPRTKMAAGEGAPRSWPVSSRVASGCRGDSQRRAGMDARGVAPPGGAGAWQGRCPRHRPSAGPRWGAVRAASAEPGERGPRVPAPPGPPAPPLGRHRACGRPHACPGGACLQRLWAHQPWVHGPGGACLHCPWAHGPGGACLHPPWVHGPGGACMHRPRAQQPRVHGPGGASIQWGMHVSAVGAVATSGHAAQVGCACAPLGAWHGQGAHAWPGGVWPTWVVHPSPPVRGSSPWVCGLGRSWAQSWRCAWLGLCCMHHPCLLWVRRVQGFGVGGCQWGNIQLLGRLGCS